MNAQKFVGAFLLGVLLGPAAIFAQIATFDTTPVTLTLSPEYPAPGETVHLSVSSYALDINRSTIVWKAGDTVIREGEGESQATITAGDVGSVTTITVAITSESGQIGTAEARIAPSDIQILWSSDSYVPPFYKGKKIAGPSAKIDAYARVEFSNGTRTIAEKDIIYTWYRGNTELSTVSGRGRSRVTLAGPVFGTETFRVVAESVDKSQYAVGNLVITAQESELKLYENHPLYGILYHRAFVGDVNTVEKELQVTAVPYFAHTKNPHSLSYEWAVNDSSVTAHPEEPETLTINANGFSGNANLRLTAMNPSDVLMRSLGSWRIVFGGSSGMFSPAQSLFGE